MQQKASTSVSRSGAFLYPQSLAWVILVISLILTFFVYFVSHQYYEKRAKEIFKEKSDTSLLHLQEHIKEYERTVKSGVAFLQASDYVSRDEWNQFVTTLDFPEIKALAYTKIIYPDQVDSISAKMVSEGYPNFSITPKGERPYYAPVLYIEPHNTMNTKVIGFDNASEPIRRQALEEARDSGKLKLSAGLKLIQQEPSDKKMSVLLFVPYYQSPQTHDTLEERRKNIVGFVSTPFLVNEMVDANIHDHSSFTFSIDDITPNAPHRQLYVSDISSYPSKYHQKKAIEIGGRIWQFSFSSTPIFDQAVASNNPILLAIGGLIFDLTLFWVLLNLFRSRQQLREQKSILTSNESYLQNILNSSSDGIHILDAEGNLIEYSPSFIRMLGYTEAEAENLSVFDWDAKLTEHEARLILAQMLYQPMIIESVHRQKNGSIYEVEINTQPIQLNEKRVIYCSARDITERKKQLEALYLSHQMIDSANDMAFMIRIDNGYIEYANKTAQNMTGYSLNEMRTIGIDGFRHPIKDQSFLDHLQELKKIGRLTDYATITRKDGSTFPVEANVRAITHEGIDYNIAFVRDISENETYNQKIIKTSTILKEAQKLAKLGNWQLNLLTNELEWSDEIYTIFEIDPETHTPSYEGFLNAIHPEDRKLVNDAYASSIENQTFYDYTHRLLMRDGRVKYVREQGETFYDTYGTPIESRGTVHDITEQKELENILRQKNIELTKTTDRLQLATQASKIGIWVWQLNDNTLTWDQQMFELYEKEQQLETGVFFYDDWKNTIHPDDVERAEYELANAVHNGIPLDTVFRIISPSGDIKYIHSTSIVKYDEYHNPLYMVGTNRDITAEKTLEETLTLAKEAAENSNNAKSSFLANMSHEIRTPLNGVIGLIDLVLQSDLTPLQNDYLIKAEMAAKALLGVLNTILDYSKIEVNKLRLEHIPFDVHEILKNVHALFSYKAEEKNIDLRFDTDAAVPQRLLGDPLRLQQILSNLVGNAMKFTDAGEVHVSITAQTEETKCKLTVTVKDTGIGLSEEQQQNLFSPFYQADSSFTRKYGGSGLGLMITKELIELMGGTISVSSTPNGGSTFSFTALFDPYEFSAQEFETIVQRDQYNILPTTKDIHILLVEDNDLNVLVASERLKQMGLRVSVANNGLEAVEMVRENEYDAVLMDLQMPIMDGFTATKEIRKMGGKEKLPIIALSAAVMKEDQILSTQSGMNAHIAKPINKVVLRDILAKWIKF